MYKREVKYTAKNTCVMANYFDVEDLVRAIDASPYAAAYRKHHARPNEVRWAGGTYETFREGSRGMLNRYTKRIEKLMDQFTNVALEAHGIDFDYNEDFGALDRAAYENGEDCCLFGPTQTETVKAPIKVYVDQWISSAIPASVIETRGAAVMALVQVLSMFRPVSLSVVLANSHSGARTDCIQVTPAPTSPLNVSLTAWMLAAPDFVRVGYMGMTHDLAESKASDSIPALSAGTNWQSTELGKWLAAQDGVDQHVFLPMMHNSGIWGSEQQAVSWVKSELKRLLGDAYVAA